MPGIRPRSTTVPHFGQRGVGAHRRRGQELVAVHAPRHVTVLPARCHRQAGASTPPARTGRSRAHEPLQDEPADAQRRSRWRSSPSSTRQLARRRRSRSVRPAMRSRACCRDDQVRVVDAHVLERRPGDGTLALVARAVVRRDRSNAPRPTSCSLTSSGIALECRRDMRSRSCAGRSSSKRTRPTKPTSTV